MADTVMVIHAGPLPKIRGRGRKKGDGSNLRLLARLEIEGNPIFGVPRNRMLSIRQSARAAGIPIRVREIPNDDGKPTGVYAIQRLKG